ncbi:hypothetical protein [Pseudomonas paraeruginosa]|uniref:hypothetical protein n=1 Tax=Pseudomonas aeruginosa TaxID=287 RepID=UPI0021596E31|nr:hypothetical protein [Pseudomonas aeruginosa]
MSTSRKKPSMVPDRRALSDGRRWIAQAVRTFSQRHPSDRCRSVLKQDPEAADSPCRRTPQTGTPREPLARGITQRGCLHAPADSPGPDTGHRPAGPAQAPAGHAAGRADPGRRGQRWRRLRQERDEESWLEEEYRRRQRRQRRQGGGAQAGSEDEGEAPADDAAQTPAADEPPRKGRLIDIEV